jgi:orotate phosphoribosyltransferase
MTDTEALRLFRETGALLEGHFILRSGLHSRQYFQCALALQHMPTVE